MAKEKDPAKIPLIFDATMRLVLDKGFSGLTMADVARQAKIATGTLYVYFDNKEHLIDQLYLHIKSQMAQTYQSCIVPQDSFYSNFFRIWRSYFQHCYQEPQRIQFVLQFCDSGYISTQTQQVVRALFEPFNQLFVTAQAQMLIINLPVLALLSHIFGSTNALVKYHLDNHINLTDELLEAYFSMIWNGIRK